MLDGIKEKKIVVGLLGLLICLIILTGLFLKLNSLGKIKSDINMGVSYIIPGVPYYGAQNYLKGCDSPSCNAVASIFEYWNPGSVDVLEVNNKFNSGGTFKGITYFFSQKGFSAQTVRLNLDDFKNYVNSKDKIPLLFFLPNDVNQPDGVDYYPATILIGINEKTRILTFHNYWLGNNYEMSYDKFNQLENKLQPDRRGLYIIVQPKNLNEKLKEIAQRKIDEYPNKTSVMQYGEQMFIDYGVGTGAYGRKMHDVAIGYFSKVEKSPNFNDYFPPYFKTKLFYLMSKSYYGENDLDNALLYAEKSVAEDHDLNHSFRDWRGNMSWRRIATPYSFLGDIYRQKKDFQSARDNYVKALDISSDNVNAKNGMAILDSMVK